MRRLKHLMASLALLALFLVPALPAFAATDPFLDACNTTGAGTSAACTNPNRGGGSPLTGPNGTLTKVTKFISYLAGIAAVIIIIVAGLMYVMANGDPGKVGNAKDAVIYALVGIVIVIVSQGIIFFVLNRIG